MIELHLKNLRDINEEIKQIDEKIIEIRERITSPKNQIISDMPKGSGTTENALDNALTKIERLEERKAVLNDSLVSEWHTCRETFKSCHITLQQIELIKYRYYYGLSWKQCTALMKKRHPKEIWNENKVFRLHRQFISNCTNNSSKVC